VSAMGASFARKPLTAEPTAGRKWMKYVQVPADVKEEEYTSGWVLYLSHLMHTNYFNC